MTDTQKYGFLTSTERKYIDESGGPSEDTEYSKKDVKTRLNQKFGDSSEIRKALEGFEADLRRIRHYYRFVKEPQPSATYEWEDSVLSGQADVLRNLIQELEVYQATAEKDSITWIRDNLTDLLEPMTIEGFNESPSSEDREEWESRCEALTALFLDETRVRVFEYINDTPENVLASSDSKLKTEEVGDRGWKTYAGQELNRRGLIEEGTWVYSVTNRGEVVYETYQNFIESEMVTRLAPQFTQPHAALHLLVNFHHPDLWDEPDEYDQREPVETTELRDGDADDLDIDVSHGVLPTPHPDESE